VHGTGGAGDADFDVVRKLNAPRAMTTRTAMTRRHNFISELPFGKL
jgi:hypothetical protein